MTKKNIPNYKILLIEPNNNHYNRSDLSGPLGGSETVFVFLMEGLNRRPDVELDVVFRDIGSEKFIEFVKDKDYDLVISNRHPGPLFQVQGKINALYLQDMPNQEILMLISTLFQQGKLNKLIFLSHFQKTAYLQHLPMIDEGRHCLMFENMIDTSMFDKTIKKENQFIYASAPNRGLDVLLDMWPSIHKELPDYILKVAGSTDMYNVKSNDQSDQADPNINIQREEIVKIGEELFEKITNNEITGTELLGGLNHQQLIDELEKSKALLYPSTFPETCCHLLNMSLHAGAVPVTSQLGALVEKITNGDSGITIPGDPQSDQFKQNFVKAVIDIVKSGIIDKMSEINRDKYSAWDIDRLTNRLIEHTINTDQAEGENIKVLGITTSMNNRGNEAKINFRNLIWYAPIDMQTFELTGMPIDQARNTAANMAIQKGADYLLFLDSDIFVDKHFITNMMEMMKGNKADIVVSNYPFKDENQLISTARFVNTSDNKAINCYGCHKITEKDLNDPAQYRFIMAGLGAVMISTDLLKKMGKPHFRTQNVNIRHVGEDAYFFQEAKAVGAKIYVTVDTPIIHVNFENGNILPFGTEENVNLILPQIGKSAIPVTTPTSQPQSPSQPQPTPTGRKHTPQAPKPSKQEGVQPQQIHSIPIPPRAVESKTNILTSGESLHRHYNKDPEYKGSDLIDHDRRIINIIDACRTHIKQGKILDLGSGDGFLKKYLINDVIPQQTGKASPAFEITSMDIANVTGNINHNADHAPYPFNDQSFDGIVCSELLEHVFNPHTVIEECHRVLKTNGTMISTIPNFNSIDNILNRHQQIAYNPENTMSVEHIRHYTLSSITQIVMGKFNIVRIIGNSPNMNPFFSHARNILGKYIPKNQQYPNHKIYTDKIIGECFPDKCMGLMLILKKI